MNRVVRTLITFAAVTLTIASPVAAAPAVDTSPFSIVGSGPFGTDRLRPEAERTVASIRWSRTASSGATVLVSPAYRDDPSTGERWAAFFSSLIHGPELDLLTAYIATPAEIHAICAEGIGCYGRDRLWVSEDAIGGVSPQEVAAHEYGHHVAYNRVNPPWIAVDSGTKRWGTTMNVCARARGGMAYPGNEGAFYTLNPGEAFAETYRVLNGYGADEWRVVDTSFRPTQQALDAARADVVEPWTVPTVRTLRLRLSRARTSTVRITTPLDGTLAIATATGGVNLELVSAPGSRVVARGTWGAAGGKSIDYEICGERTLLLRVSSAQARRLTLRISEP